nr:3277_t:CDS:2 [Entrophospora candida]
MKCKNCQVDKLSREFPADVISNKCQHVPSFCLKCITNYLNGRNSRQCPECRTSLNQKEIENVRFSWDQASFKIDINSINVIDDNKKLPSTSFVNRTNLVGNFYVVMLDGHKIQLRLEKIKTILALKQAISSEIKIEVTKQKLIYNEVELEDYHKNHFEKKLSDYQIVEGSHIQLIVLLYSISKKQSLNNLTFDLFWGFPGGLCDFLDGTCMLYNDRTFNRTFDYASRIHGDLKDILHSGDVMDAQNKRGHHRITVNLSSLPLNITKLYFILSSWSSPNIGSFPNPSFKLYDPDKPNEQLCRYNIRMAASSQALIMCVVSKNKIDGIWNIYEIGRLSSGNANNYILIATFDGSCDACFQPSLQPLCFEHYIFIAVIAFKSQNEMKFCAEKESKASFGANIRTATILDFMMILTVDDVEYELVFLESSRLIGSTSPEKIRDGNFKLLRVVNDGMPEMQAKKGSVWHNSYSSSGNNLFDKVG